MRRSAKSITLRPLEAADAEVISAAFDVIGWNKPVSLYEEYLRDQMAGRRDVIVAEVEGQFVGYVTVMWETAIGIPEIMDLNVLPDFRRRGVGTRMMDQAECRVAERSDVVAIGVGMYPDYGPAQCMYVHRGYIPDGRGLIYGDDPVSPGQIVTVDDDLILHLTKRLR
jgi:GNAT superfamily N-acetyltransferase